MKTYNETKKLIKEAVNEDLDMDVFAVRESDGFKTCVLNVLGNTDTIENYMSIMDKNIKKLENLNWTIKSFKVKF